MRIELIRAYYDSPEYLKRLQDRAENMRLLSVDPLVRARMILDVYSVDFERFCEDFLFLIIPEFGDAIKPFFLFEYQKKIIRKIQDAERYGGDIELLVDKPRGMGVTWLIVAYFYWRWLFQPNWTAFILSRTEAEVDDGTATPSNSIFAKFRWMMQRTPKWMLPEGFETKGKKGTSHDSSLRIINPVMGTALMGSSTNSNAGRSRRYSIILVDECFSIDRFTEVHRSLQSVARIQVYVSTTKASREAKKFKDMCEEAGNYISLDWKDHPWKDQEWYEEQLKKAEFDPEVMKEVDKGYSVSERMQYYPQIKESIVARIDYNPSLPLYCGLDFGKNDLTVIVFAQFSGNQLNILSCYANKGKGKAEWYAPFMNPEAPINPAFAYSELQMKTMNKYRSWRKPTAWFGEVAHTIKSMADNRSIASVLATCGIRIIVNNYAIEHEPRRKATSLLLPKMCFNEGDEGAMDLYDAVANSRYKKSTSSKEVSMSPEHDDEIADYRAALENLCVNIGRVFKHQREDVGDTFRNNNFASNIIKFLKV
jgi:hypothetical protein